MKSFCKFLAFAAAISFLEIIPKAGATIKYWNGTGTWTTASTWGLASGGPYTSTWVTGDDAVFNVASSTVTGATTAFASLAANENVTMTAAGTIGTGGTVATITVANGKTFDFNGQAISTAAGTGFIKAGAGTLAMGAAGAYPGGFTLNAGTVTVGGVNSLGAGGFLAINGGTLQASSATTRDLSGKYAGGITIGGDFSFSGSGALNFANTMSLGGLVRNITNNATATILLGSLISGTAGNGLALWGTGTTSFTNGNTYSGNTTVNSGTLSMNDSGNLNSGSTLVLNGGTFLRASQNFTPARANAYKFSVSVTADSTIQTTASGTGGTRTMHFDTPSFAGVAGTTLLVTNSSTTGGTNIFRIYSGGVNYSGNIIIGGSGSTNRAILQLYNTNNPAGGSDDVFSGLISGGGIVYKNVDVNNPGGNVIFSSANTYTGGTEIRGGFFGLGTDNALGFGNVTIGFDSNPIGLFASGGARLLTNDVIADVASTSASTASGSTNLQIKGSQDLTLAGRILIHTNTMFFTISNSGLTTFSGMVTNAGATSLGICKLGFGKLILSGNNTFSGSNTIAAGTLVLGGSNSYSGVTIVSGGTLLVNNPTGSASGTNSVTIYNGGTLGGTGIISGVVSNAVDGTIAPGATGIGALTLGTPPVLLGTNFARIDRNGGLPLADKLILTSGTLTYGGTLTVANTGAALTGGEVFTLFAAPSYTGSFSATNLPSLGAALNWRLNQLPVNGTLIVNRSPVANTLTVSRVAGFPLKLALSDLAANWTDADGDTIVLSSVSASTNLVTPTMSGGFIFYTNNANVDDQFAYTISDGQGGTATGLVNVVTTTSAISGQVTGIIAPGGGPVNLAFAGIPSYSYNVQRSTNVTEWVTIWTTNAPSGGLFNYTDDFSDLGGTAPASAYYRLGWIP